MLEKTTRILDEAKANVELRHEKHELWKSSSVEKFWKTFTCEQKKILKRKIQELRETFLSAL